MLHPSTRKLIDRLAEMTELGKLDWTESDGGNLVYSTEGYSVALSDAADEIVITSIDGKELERAGAADLAATTTESGGSYTDVVSEMAKEAARIARGTETAISTLLAGMDEAPEVEEEVEIVSDALEDQEDPGDDTSILAADDIPTKVESQPSEPSQTEESAPEEEPLASNDTDSTETEISADTETASDSDTIETESGVTEAVARMADEVNQREDSGLGAAAASAVGAVALAAGLAEDDDDDAPQPAEDVEAEEIVAETTPVTSDHVYVPFGLEQEDDEPLAAAAQSDITDETGPEVAAAPLEEAPTAEVEQIEETKSEAESVAAPILAAVPEIVIEDTSETTSEDTAANDAPHIPSSEPAFGFSATPEPAAEPSTPPIEADAAALEEETVEAASAEPEIADTTEPTPAPAQVYSLSGIGAGFGLGALSAKTEASGVPGPGGIGSTNADKIVIDATEDLLPEIEGQDSLPPLPVASEELSFGTGSEKEPEAESGEDAESDSDILKPRTRFNPWD